jgi:hypothetical protein
LGSPNLWLAKLHNTIFAAVRTVVRCRYLRIPTCTSKETTHEARLESRERFRTAMLRKAEAVAKERIALIDEGHVPISLALAATPPAIVGSRFVFEISRAALARGLPHGARKRRRARARHHTHDAATSDSDSSADGDNADDRPGEEQASEASDEDLTLDELYRHVEGAAKETDSHRYWRVTEQG